ncbi:MAG: PGDYG domain-containing protein [Anaerolineae bacterium]|nr:PGDYG domain-containing protein [Anaerolineae bacterium]
MLSPDQLMARGFLPYRKKTITYAKQMRTRFRVQMDNGEIIHGQPGDYACVSHADGGRWIVARDVFERTYAPVQRTAASQDTFQKRLLHHGFRPFRKHQITWARRMRRPRVIHTLEGDVTAQAGDFLCIGSNGELWPQKAERFAAHYEPVERQARSQ